MKIHAGDPGEAAQLSFAAAWLFCRTSELNAVNMQRAAIGASMAFDDNAFTDVQREALQMAETGEIPEWANK